MRCSTCGAYKFVYTTSKDRACPRAKCKGRLESVPYRKQEKRYAKMRPGTRTG